jgi:hypothetical protein
MDHAGAQQGNPMMRHGLMLAIALAAMSTTSAYADDEWCGYATGDKALIECGYSSVAQCENAVGKGGVCFVDPEYALKTKRPTALQPVNFSPAR